MTMIADHLDRKSHFEQAGQAYERYRPTYPATLVCELRQLAPSDALAVDVGCGTGQLTTLLNQSFNRVIGCDISADQIANAVPGSGICYHVCSSDGLPVKDRTACLVTVAQAAHWFDLERLFAEVRRVAMPDTVLALIAYGVLTIRGALDARFQRFYWDDLKPYWPAERRHVESGYAYLPFPFTPIEPPRLWIERRWNLSQLLGYVETWSAVKAARRKGAGSLVDAFRRDAHRDWGRADGPCPIEWPISLKLGRL